MKRVIFYAAGPGDVVGTFGSWKYGLDDPSETAVCYSSMFFDACRESGLSAYVVSSHCRKDIQIDDQFTVENRPQPRWARGGLSYHFGHIYYQIRLIVTASRVRAKIAVVSDVYHWWIWFLGWILGIKVVPTLHCAFWPSGFRDRSLKSRIVDQLNSVFWRIVPWKTICISPEVQRQLQQIAGSSVGNHAVQARAHYRKSFFADIDVVENPSSEFRSIFAGRLERNKGVFDLVSIASALRKEDSCRYLFQICGGGPAEEELKRQVEDRDLTSVVNICGKLGRTALIKAFANSHVVVVPTTATFAEGLNKVAIESILAGRPCVTSKVSHAVDVLGDAVVEVPVGNVDAYVDAIKRLHDDKDEYMHRQIACQVVQQQFYDYEVSWGGVLLRILRDSMAFSPDGKRSNGQ